MYKYNKGLISVVIPCYNGERFIDRCLNALLNQTYKKIEVIIINDGSTDNTMKKLEEYIEKFNNNNMFLKVINQKNAGQAKAVNEGLKLVTGEYLVWQDIDDFYRNDGLQNLKKYLEEHKEMDFVRGEVAWYKENNLDNPIRIGKSNNPQNTNIFENYLFINDVYSFCGIFMARMSFFDKCIKGRNIYISRGGQNWQLILPMAYYGKCGYLSKIVFNQVEVKNSHSRTKYKTIQEAINREDTLEDILKNILEYLNIYTEYKKQINLVYLRKKLIVSFKYGDKAYARKIKNKIEKDRKLTIKEKIIYICTQNLLLFKIAKLFLKNIIC